ncbi:MAG: hypothetical protein LBN28_03750 [Desulfovibrio sp.]|jgi:hypothetical protein|nr:hypothetical protein [Desulfovibrio sp.]
MNKNPAKIRYSYSTASDSRLQTAHGVWGSINAQGEIERKARPPYTVLIHL